MLCCLDYSERVVDSFEYQIQPEYYVVNRYVSIESISLEHFSTTAHTETEETPQARTRHAVFHLFFV